ncbi:DUF6519 domain-containing protein [Streptomyces sp. NPDC096132]|uniref:DUF6519 domain-containing protein n=1 Tax=Streptomyces sp. NPDC096132 TaxID=3366075 RepID=UPI00380802DF
MKGDFSRRTHQPHKHYSAVLHEQGRVLTDADLDEEHRILSGAHETAVADLAGGCGAPVGSAGFAVTSPDGVGLRLSAGRFYADGILVVNEEDVAYDAQPDRDPEHTVWPPAPGSYAVYLDVWRRLVTALDDPSIREVALGGPTTSARERTVWQVRYVPVNDGWTCEDGLPVRPGSTGRMAAQADPESAPTSPCLLPPRAGYTGLENQLYRVEVLVSGPALDIGTAPLLPVVAFPEGTADRIELSPAHAAQLTEGDVVELVATGPGSDAFDATFAQVVAVDNATVTLTGRVPRIGPADAPAVRRARAAVVVSRENGSVVTGVTSVDGAQVTVTDLGPDSVLGFAPGQWIELTDDTVELEALKRQLRQVEAVDPDLRIITLSSPALPLAERPGGVDPDLHPKLRRWDAARAITFGQDGSGWIHLEEGIRIRFTAGDYANGDYWQFAARTAVVDPDSGTIEWPHDDNKDPRETAPAGVDHHLCPLAQVKVTERLGTKRTEVTHDCRPLVPPLTGLTNLLYVGGDGQEAQRASSGAVLPLPAPLTVRVANGPFPVPGAKVAFQVPGDAGQVSPPQATTDGRGIARADWTPGPSAPAQTVEAYLLDRPGNRIAHQVVAFNATLGRKDCCVSVGPAGDFPTVDEAVSALVDLGELALCLCLTPGDHFVRGGILDAGVRRRPFHLSLRGCGRGTRVFLGEAWELDGWTSFRLLDLDLWLPRDGGLTTRDTQEVQLENVHVTGGVDERALVRIHDAQRVSVIGCRLVPLPGKALARLAGLLEDLKPLGRPWLEGHERFQDSVRALADELEAMPARPRAELGGALRQLAADKRRRLPGLLERRLDRLGLILGHDVVTVPALLGVLELLPAALGGFEAGVALEIGPRDEFQDGIENPSFIREADVVVARNDIAGDLSLYGARSREPLASGELTELGGWVGKGSLLTAHGGTVHVRENHVHRLTVSAGMISALLTRLSDQEAALTTVYDTLHVVDNVFENRGSVVLARHTTLSGNEFAVGAVVPLALTARTGTAALVIADSAIISANHAAPGSHPVHIRQVTRTFTEGLNLDVHVV